MSDTEDTDGLGKSFETLNIKTLTVENIDIPSTDADNQFGTIKLSDNLEIAGDGLILHDLDNLEFSISDDNKIITYEDNSTATATYASNTVIISSVSKTISTEENINLNGRTYTITQTGTTITLVEPLKKIISLEGGNLVIATYKSSGLRIDKEVIMDSNNSISEITNAAFDLKIKSLDVTKINSINDTIPNEGCVRIDDTLTVAGATTLNGVVTLGDSTGDDITINGRMASNIVPKTDATYDLGTTTLGFKDLHLGSGGIINLDGGDVTLTHSTGKLTLGGDGTVEFDFDNHEMTNVDINSGAIDGVTIGTNTACTSLVATTVAINGGSIDSTTIGFTTPSTGTFTTLTVNDALIIAAGATITGDTANQITLAITGVSGQTANLLTIEQYGGTDKLVVDSNGVTTAVSLVANTADINGGSIDSTTIGFTTPSTGIFTTLTVNDALIIAAGATITGDTANQITLAITGVSGQSANLLTIEQSDGTDKLTVNSDGVTTAVSLVANTADINSGTVDATIGATTPASGTFTTLTANTSLTCAKSLILTPSVITSASTDDLDPTDLDESISVFYFDLNSDIAMYGIFAAGTTGQVIHIFYDNSDTSGSMRIDFGSTKLRTGSGNSQYLTFSTTGQSASLMYISTVDKWCVLNTGATVL